MKNKPFIYFNVLILFLGTSFKVQKSPIVKYVDFFENVNHPEIAYWFFSKEVMADEHYLNEIDYLAEKSKFDLIFLTSRNGLNFYDYKTMHPVFKKLVDAAHQKGLKIGLQLWEDHSTPIAIENTERIIVENEVLLDASGTAKLVSKAKHVRSPNVLLQSELFKVYAFKKVNDGFYDPATLKDITTQCESTSTDKATVNTTISVPDLKGYTAFVMTQHYYKYYSNDSPEAAKHFTDALKAYSDIPFDGVGLDEYTNLRVATTGELNAEKSEFRESPYSLSMAKKFEDRYHLKLDKAIFNKRYAPLGKPQVRAQAINYYMELMRQSTMNVEQAVYQTAIQIFGNGVFTGLHNTHHNRLDGDEIWQTGLNWWNVPRSYGQTDEGTPTSTQLGVAKSYPQNVLYNMYYNKSLDKITTKALTDLRYGIRTHYHALNDVQNWGVNIDKPEAMEGINPVENCARLLNHFNPALPQTKLLVIFGMEALANWYPNAAERGICDINDKLNIEGKAQEIWNAGYRNALVPTDLILDGRLKLNEHNKPVLNGHEFEAVVFLYPQYAHPSVIKFLENYEAKGGKLMIEGNATSDFSGANIEPRWKKIYDKATVKSYNISKLSELGLSKNAIEDGAVNEDGSLVFTNKASLDGDGYADFNFEKNGNSYSGKYKGMAAIAIDEKGQLIKLAATGFTEFSKNGKVIFSLDKAADIYMQTVAGNVEMTIADKTHSIKPHINY